MQLCCIPCSLIPRQHSPMKELATLSWTGNGATYIDNVLNLTVGHPILSVHSLGFLIHSSSLTLRQKTVQHADGDPTSTDTPPMSLVAIPPVPEKEPYSTPKNKKKIAHTTSFGSKQRQPHLPLREAPRQQEQSSSLVPGLPAKREEKRGGLG